MLCQIKLCCWVMLGWSLMALPATKSVALTSQPTFQSVKPSPDEARPNYSKDESRHLLRKVNVRVKRELKNHPFIMTNKVDFDSLFDRPIEDWSGGQWIGLVVITLLATVALCCLCSIIRLVFGCLCPCLTCGRSAYRRRYYAGSYYNSFLPPEDLRPPPYNPVYYANRQSRSVPTNECGILDCLALLCCLQCCRQNRFSLCDVFCGLCCFEFCCRGGRDVLGNEANAGVYGTFV